MVGTLNIAWQVENVSFPLNLPVNVFFHSVRSVDLHFHAAFELLLVLSGNIVLYSDVGERLLSAGDLAIIHGGQPHATQDTGTANLVLALQIDPAIARHDAYFNRRRFDLDALSGDDRASTVLHELRTLMCQIMCETRMKRSAWQMEVEALVLRLIALLVRKMPSHLEEEDANALLPDEARALGERLRHVAEYIRRHASEPVSISDVSNALGFSSGYLSRLFKAQTGASFGKFVTSVRLRKSLELFSGQNRPNVTNVALECGFPNVKAFNLAFRRVYGCTPSEWRKERNARAMILQASGKPSIAYLVADDENAVKLLYHYMGPVEPVT